jgi:hypothetical protein
MTSGVKTPSLPLASALDEVLGNLTVDNLPATRRQTVDAFVQQLLGTAAMQAAIAAAAAGTVASVTWSGLSGETADDGTLGRVTGPDAGTHTDPVTSATVANTGEYIKASAGWRRTGDLHDFGGLAARVAVLEGQVAAILLALE